jgi:uncharacterized protein YjbJ (UPF0337 family)
VIDYLELVRDAVEGFKDGTIDEPPEPTDHCPLAGLKRTISNVQDMYEKTANLIRDPSLDNAKALLREASQALGEVQDLIPLKQLEKAKEKIDYALDKIEQAEKVIESAKKVAQDAEKFYDDPNLENAGALLGSTKDALGDASQALDDVLPGEAKQAVRQAQQTLGDARSAVNKVRDAF